MNYEKIYLTTYKDAMKEVALLITDIPHDDYIENSYREGYIMGMQAIIKIMVTNHEKELEKELDKLR